MNSPTPELPCMGRHCDGDCPAGEGATEEACQNAWADLNEQAWADHD